MNRHEAEDFETEILRFFFPSFRSFSAFRSGLPLR